MSNNQANYISKYNKEKYKMYQFRIKKDDVKIIEKLDNVSNRNNYILNLIQNDIEPNILTIKEIKQKIKPVMEKYQVNEVFLFGSYARGEATSESDVDIYCSKGNLKSLIDEARFIDELEVSLNKKVDVVTIGSLMDEYFKQQLEGDLIKLC